MTEVEIERKRAEARRLAEQAGARIVPFGAGWRVVGPTIDVVLSDFAMLNAGDFSTAGGGWDRRRARQGAPTHGG